MPISAFAWCISKPPIRRDVSVLRINHARIVSKPPIRRDVIHIDSKPPIRECHLTSLSRLSGGMYFHLRE